MNLANGKNLQSNKTTVALFVKRRYVLLFISFVLISTSTFSQQNSLLCKNWKYISITDTLGTPKKRIGENDRMLLSDDAGVKKFSYSLEIENIFSNGIWEIKDSTLKFIYDSPSEKAGAPVIRYFKITRIDSTALQIKELHTGTTSGLLFNYGAPEK